MRYTVYAGKKYLWSTGDRQSALDAFDEFKVFYCGSRGRSVMHRRPTHPNKYGYLLAVHWMRGVPIVHIKVTGDKG